MLVDCPPSLGLLTINTLTAADSVLIPLQCEYYALEGLTQLIKTIQLVQHHLNPGLRIEGVLLTMFDARLNLSQQVADEARTFFAERVYRTVIPRNVRLSEAPSFGQPIINYDSTCAGAESYRALTEEVLHGEVPDPPAIETSLALETAPETALDTALDSETMKSPTHEPAFDSGLEPAIDSGLDPALDAGLEPGPAEAFEPRIEDDPSTVISDPSTIATETYERLNGEVIHHD